MVNTRSRNTTLDRMMTLNRALDQAFNAALTGDSRVWVPAIDVVEQKDAYVLYAELPGVDASQVDISFEQNVLTIRGTKRSAIEASNEGELRVYAAERVTGSFERSIRLPEFVDADRIHAEFTNGLLTIKVPKAQAAQPRRIEIKADTHRQGEISSVSNATTDKASDTNHSNATNGKSQS
jgi:HSP20 family protein